MADFYYKDALRLGQREYRARIAQGLSPLPAVLDDIVSEERAAAGVDLGVISVPMEYVTGVKSRSRVNLFAANFMPLAEETSEFAAKWDSLCRAHLTEGIREPIRAYEYMNRFYVLEGNKRVSVLKYFGAVAVPAHVTRILPERTGDEAVERYYEFLDYYKCSHLLFPEFSHLGSCAALCRCMGMAPDQEWTEEQRRRFTAGYHTFSRALAASGGRKLRATVGDALLAYLRVYGYESLFTCGSDTLKKDIGRIWEELRLSEESEAVEVKSVPAAEKKPGLLSKVLPAPALKAAFLHDMTPERSGWTYEHEQGRQYAQRVLGERIETTAVFDAMDDPDGALAQVIDRGCRLVFTTSPRLLAASLRAAIAHPEVVVMNCSLNTSHRYIRSYSTRMYEPKFIIGAMASAMNGGGDLGYVCDYPIFGQLAGINAFALGALMVNPSARIHLEWSSVKGAKEAAEALAEKGIRFISTQDTTRYANGHRSAFGLSYYADNIPTLLAAPQWRWGVYYESILRQMLDGTVKEEYRQSHRALNYYWGMSAGVVDIEYADVLPRGTRRLAEYLKGSIVRGDCNPFLAPLHTQDGRLIGERQDVLSLEQIINMDYLVDNVVGAIPQYEELNDIGRATVDNMGVTDALKRGDL